MHGRAIEEALQATGELLAADNAHAALVVVGGAALAVLQLVSRVTNDVDVIAIADRANAGHVTLLNAQPLPESVTTAARTVARDLGLPPDWLNSVVGAQIHAGFPPDISDDLTWKRYAGLDVGFAGRRTLIALKLFAAADRARGSVHHQDLVALRPTDVELAEAARWVLTQDAAPEYPQIVREVIADVRRRAN